MTETPRGTLALRLYYVAAVSVGGIYLPFFPRWLESRGMLGARLGMIAAAAPAMGVVAPTAFGWLADRLRLRGGLLQVACAGALVAFGALALAALDGLTLDFGFLLGVALVFALFRSPMGFVADMVAIEIAPAARTTYGRLRLWGSLGFIVTVPIATHYVDPAAPRRHSRSSSPSSWRPRSFPRFDCHVTPSSPIAASAPRSVHSPSTETSGSSSPPRSSASAATRPTISVSRFGCVSFASTTPRSGSRGISAPRPR